MVRGETLKPEPKSDKTPKKDRPATSDKPKDKADDKALTVKKEKPAHKNPKDVVIHISHNKDSEPAKEVIHLSLDNSKGVPANTPQLAKNNDKPTDVVSLNSDDVIVANQETTSKTIASDTKAVSQETNETAPSEAVAHEVLQINDTQPNAEQTEQHQAPSADKADDTAQADENAQNADIISQTEKVSTTQNPTGRAKNDPRSVITAKPAIAGTAGAFIVSVLGARQGDFVADFLQAMATWQQPFDFANYGYEPLTADYLSAFTACTSAKAHHQTPQGKTHAVPPAVSVRAKNDPRGQLGDEPVLQHLHLEPPSTDTSENVDVTIGDDGQADVSADTVSVTFVQDGKTDDTEIAESATETVAEPMAEHTEIATETETANDEIDSDKSDDKKRLNSYKDMIESVSGQLLPQVGILNLVAAKKKPIKLKTPKKPIKKTSKAAQKAEVVKRVKTDDTPADTPPSNDGQEV